VRLKDWQANGWLRPHETSTQEITNLLGIVERAPNKKKLSVFNGLISLRSILRKITRFSE
jgi:hypothetical protein